MSYSDAESRAQQAATAALKARHQTDDPAIAELARSVELLSKAVEEFAAATRRDR